MEHLFKELAWKCHHKGLNFQYNESIGGLYVFKVTDKGVVRITDGYIKDWEYESPTDALKRMHDEVDSYE